MLEINQHRSRIGAFHSSGIGNICKNSTAHSSYTITFKPKGSMFLFFLSSFTILLLVSTPSCNLDGNQTSYNNATTQQYCPPKYQPTLQSGNIWSISNTARNKAIKTTNGNGSKALKITHWNMGSSHWVNQIPEINLLLANKDPDLAIFSEANIFNTDQEYELHIPGYTLILPRTMDLIGNCRVAILVKEGVDVQVLDKFMDPHIASIWLKISAKGNKIIHLGAVYRQHMWIKQSLPNNTKHPAQQYARWKDFITQWIAASRGAETFVIGDTNLDHNKWVQPDGDHINMTNLVKTQIETLGFHQMVTGSTRFWPGTRPSLVDKCWTNCPERLLKIRNETRASSDHNLQYFEIRIAGKENIAKEVYMRDRSNMNLDRFKSDIAAIDWSRLYATSDINLAYHIF